MKANVAQFKVWCRDHYNLAHTVCEAMAYAQCKREQVDAYVKPIFDGYKFYVKKEWAESATPERITDPERIYLTDQEDEVQFFFDDCDKAHRAHGFTGPKGHCPALCAEELQRIAERALLDAAKPLFGIGSDDIHRPEDRRKMLDLLIGACLNLDKQAA